MIVMVSVVTITGTGEDNPRYIRYRSLPFWFLNFLYTFWPYWDGWQNQRIRVSRWVFPEMVVSPKHPKMIQNDHFSRKTDGCWAPSLLGNPQIKRGWVDLPIGFSVGSRRVTHHAALQLFQNALFLGFAFFSSNFDPPKMATGERCFSWKNIMVKV